MTEQEKQKEMRILWQIQDEELKIFVGNFLTEYSNDTKIKEANKVGDIILLLLEERGDLKNPVRAPYIDILLASSMLHNVFYEENKVSTLFLFREKVLEAIKDLPKDLIIKLYGVSEMIEGQLGKSTYVPKCIPNEMTPQGLFAQAIWINKKFIIK